MDESRFDAMVARLELESATSPGAYKARVALLAAAGFVLLAGVLAVAGSGILLLAAGVIVAVATGGKAILLLLKLGKFVILLAAPLWFLIKSSVTALFTRLPPPEGRELARTEAPHLFAAMDGMRTRMKGPRFHHVLVTADMNAAVVQRPFFGLFGFPRNYLLLGLPLLESLSADEALSVVAHEYGHLSGAHARFGAWIYRLRITWGTIQEIAARWTGIGGKLLRGLVSWYAPYFNAYTFVLARANEYQADAASAELVSPAVAANALKRVNISAAQYQHFFEDVFSAVRTDTAPPGNVAERWSLNAIVMPPTVVARQWLAESLGREKSHFDTHPVLRNRLRALPGQASDVEVLPPPLEGPSAAVAWLGSSLAALRIEQQAEWRDRVKDYWHERHADLQAQLARLSELRAADGPTPEQKAERLRLEVALEPTSDHLPDLATFNGENPGWPSILYLEGSVRLDRGDEAGIQLLERAMELDGDAIKPCCERAHEFMVRQGRAGEAKGYADRWRVRHEWEQERTRQLEALDTSHELREPDLDAEAMDFVRRSLAAHAGEVSAAWIARRVIPADADALTYVIGIKLTLWARFRSKGPKVVNRLAAVEWPMHAYICILEGDYRSLGERMARLAGARVLG